MKDVVAVAALLAIAVGLVFAFAPKTITGIAGSTVAPVSYAVIATGSDSSVASPVNYLITSESQLEELWTMASTSVTVPDINFASTSVLAIFAGQKPSAGYAVQVAAVADWSSERLVSIVLEAPPAGCKVAVATTSPFEIVAVPATSLPLSHQYATATVPCD